MRAKKGQTLEKVTKNQNKRKKVKNEIKREPVKISVPVNLTDTKFKDFTGFFPARKILIYSTNAFDKKETHFDFDLLLRLFYREIHWADQLR